MSEKTELVGDIKPREHYGEYHAVYQHRHTASHEQRTKIQKLHKLKKEYDDFENEIKKDIKHSLNTTLPASFKVEKIILDCWKSHEITFTADCVGLRILRTKGLEPKTQTTQDECPYKKLRESHELKQILNCGVLSKAEKRKVLGLPDEAK